MKPETIERRLIEYIRIHGGIATPLGKLEFTKSNRIGQGGNGVVYLATINEKEIAIKFLISDSEHKHVRFKSEYFNTNYVRDELKNIVNMIYYGELELQSDISIPYIIMTRYSKNLETSRAEMDKIEEKDFIKLVKFLFTTLKAIHKKGIIHRDIKPENILVDKANNLVLSDFGISHYDKENFPIDNKTRKDERLANVAFSAPEQIINQYEITQAVDIYSMAQIMYWFIFKTINRGTGTEYISAKYDWNDALIFDKIISKCLMNNPAERFQSIDEIEMFYENEKEKMKIVNPFNDMHTFRNAILSVFPEFYNSIYSITDKESMSKLFYSIFSNQYNQPIHFNTGTGNGSVCSITILDNTGFLMDHRQLNILKIWGLLTDDVYDDILLLEIGESLPYIIDGKEYQHVGVVENKDVIPCELMRSGYIRYNGDVCNVSNLNIQERYVENNYKIIAIAPFHNCVVLEENDVYLEALQKKETIKPEDIYALKEKVHRNRSRDVSMRL